jgi:hypothetical protein
MTSIETFKRLLLKVNKNDTNADIDISKGEFVLLFNEQAKRWLKTKLNEKENVIDVQDLAEIQVKFFPLTKLDENLEYAIFQLPDNFFNYASSYSVCSSGTCTGIRVFNFPYKPLNENMLLEDYNSSPSLDYEETLVDLSQGKIFVFKDDFTVDQCFLNYYRSVIDIDIEGYIRLDGSQSTNINPDVQDQYVDEIIDRCALEIIRRYQSPDGFEMARERIATE